MSGPPFIDLAFAPASVETRPLPDGGSVLSSPMLLQPAAASLGAMFSGWAGEAPDRTFLAERDADGAWRRLTYAAALERVLRLGQAMLDLGLDATRPVMLLSGNSLDNALVQLAAMHVGVPAAPISPAYSLLSRDLEKLRYIAGLVAPGMVYAADGVAFERALGVVATGGAEVVVGARPGRPARILDDLLSTEPGTSMRRAHAAVGSETVAKILFTSGSTGMPKGVVNTQGMMCSNQQAIAQLWPFLEERPPVIVDWLPWSHTFGGNHNFNMIMRNGGALYIDAGKPAPGLFDSTVANLRDVRSTMSFNVPVGFGMLVPRLETDDELRETFFHDLDVIFYAAAALPQVLWEKLEKLSIATRGARVRMLSAWGSTETAPLSTSVHFTIERAGVIGLPAPGTEIKLAPSGNKMELRVRGPNVTPGYWRRDDLTAAAFDDEGFFRMGDAGKLADPEDPSQGLVFDGRTAENFKLTSGTWVNVGELRLALIDAGAPIVHDAVLTGHDREEIGALVFPNFDACRSLIGEGATELAVSEIVRHAAVRDALSAALGAHNAVASGTSRKIARVLILEEPPDMDANEITDKGYVNQRAVLERRADLVLRLHGEGGSDVVVPGPRPDFPRPQVG